MYSATRSRAGSSASSSPSGMVLLRQTKLLINEAVQEIELKMKGELDLMTKEQIALNRGVKVTTDGLTGRLTDVEK